MTRPLLSAEQRAAALEGRLQSTTEALLVDEDETEPVRLLGRPADDGVTVMVGASLADVADALELLLAQLVIGGVAALALASVAGYVLAGAALRPVEEMRRRATAISADTAGERLPLPVAHDEVRRLGETLNAMLERLDGGVRRERRFIADASHELRSPLALLQTELDLARRRPRRPEDLQDALHSAGEEVDRLTRLAEDLLVLASTEEEQLRLQRASFAVRDLLEQVARQFATRADAADRAVEVGHTPPGSMDGDRLRLERALGNLVDNALRHGGGRILLDAAADDGGVVLRVSDEGAGFPAAFVSSAFERFTRDDEARTEPGAGLGLAIVETIARAHGGQARAANRPEGGAIVELVIPTHSTNPADTTPHAP
ncbi:MAG TPA: ATP-binding protein [Euzebyales bacterium]|nr:ATP-binding protein [Euzebyales bacterium]